MQAAFLAALAEQWPLLAFVALCLTALCGGPWRFLVRMFATAAAVCFALSSFCGLMDAASRVFFGMVWEALRQCRKEIVQNRRDALEEMGERA
jgi:hypothetical protein